MAVITDYTHASNVPKPRNGALIAELTAAVPTKPCLGVRWTPDPLDVPNGVLVYTMSDNLTIPETITCFTAVDGHDPASYPPPMNCKATMPLDHSDGFLVTDGATWKSQMGTIANPLVFSKDITKVTLKAQISIRTSAVSAKARVIERVPGGATTVICDELDIPDTSSVYWNFEMESDVQLTAGLNTYLVEIQQNTGGTVVNRFGVISFFECK